MLDSLRDADRDAPSGDSGALVMPCPREREAVELRIMDEADEPLPDIIIELAKGPDEVIRTKSDAYGHVRFDGLVPGSYSIRLPRTDARAWEPISTATLGAATLSSGDATWAPPAAEREPEPCVVVLGDCVESIAFRHGFLPDTVWGYGENGALRADRIDMHVLSPGDILQIPPRQDKEISASTGHLYLLRRKGVPASLNVQILDFADQPVAGAAFLLSVELCDGSALPDRTGVTGKDGFVRSPIPPHSARGTLTVKDDDETRVIEFDLGRVNPVDEISGLQGRLRNLGYYFGDADGVFNRRTAAALKLFQLESGLSATGRLDAATKSRLVARFGS